MKKYNGFWTVYSSNNNYYLENGSEYTVEKMHMEHPASVVEVMAVRLAGTTILEVQPILYLRSIYNIDLKYTDEEACGIINMKIQEEESESTPLERIAAALEFIELLSM